VIRELFGLHPHAPLPIFYTQLSDNLGFRTAPGGKGSNLSTNWGTNLDDQSPNLNASTFSNCELDAEEMQICDLISVI
jgi:hypothetical protein